ncbi:MAG: hypothetical protein COA78_24580 [Blastopirellula sp.]|nr:MAG: hypothetical protein COA78_24580 [Blastopirellula sp.]
MKQRKASSYPLILLIMFVTVSAILVRMMTPVIQALVVDGVDGPDISAGAMAGVAGALVFLGVVTGFLVGLCHHQRTIGALFGIVAGGGVGLVATPLVFIPIQLGTMTMMMTFAAAIIMVATGVLIPRTTIINPVEEDPLKLNSPNNGRKKSPAKVDADFADFD